MSARDAPAAIVTTEGLGRRVAQRWLWRGVELKIVGGDRIGVGGGSGSGKTLFLRSLAALDPVDEGRILADGVPLRARDVPAYRARVIYVQQRPAVFPGTVAENLERPFALARHSSRHFDRARASELLAALGMPAEFLTSSCDGLSGGETQIVSLARALLLAPRVLLLDEPTSSLDGTRVANVEAVVDAWLSGLPQRACIWVSHTEQQLERVCTRRLHLDAGPE